ncbi:MAG: carboxypeptidase regulatory-like domain-containing protein [Acidobacteriota bacterium]
MNLMRIFAVLIASALVALGQTAQITGRITDSSGAIMPGVNLAVSNLATGIDRKSSSNEQGYYAVPLLPPGKYKMSVQAQGFRSILRDGISLEVDQVARIDFVMEVGQVTESVEVKGTAGLLDTATTSVSTVVPNQKILDLPLIGRNPAVLAQLVPGVRGIGGYGGGFGGLPVSTWSSAPASIGGGTPISNQYMIDGIANEAFISGGMNTFLSVDATEEFRIVTHNAAAEYGRTGGGVINLISKSGTNEFHGSAFEFLRNKVLNANGFFANRSGRTRSPFTFNQYGATLGGPVVKNRTFFFFNWEQVKQRTQARAFRTVPTELQRQGDFSQTRDAGGRLIQIYDPNTTTGDPQKGLTREAFPGNVIPPSRIHPVARAVAKYYPAPNLPGLPNTAANNFVGEASAPLDKSIFGIKLDHNFTSEKRLSGRFTQDKTLWVWGNLFGNIAENNYSDGTMPRRSVALNYTDAIRPDFLLEARAGLNRYSYFRPTRSYGFDVASIGLPASLNSQMQIRRFPSFSPGDVSGLGPVGDDHLSQANESWTAAAAFTKFRGQHVVKFGVEERLYRLNTLQGRSDLSFSFGRGFTQGPDPLTVSSTAGYGYATFLLGTPGGGVAQRYPSFAMQAAYFGTFVQDDWKIHPKLTLNLGLRWEVEGAVTERYNQMTNFDPNVQSQLGNLSLRGGAVFSGVGGIPRGMRNTTYKDFGPRIGFAYQVLPRTSLRGGWGFYYLPGTGYFTAPRSTGFDLTTNMITSVQTGIPFDTLTNPFPSGIQNPPGSGLGPLTGVGTSLSGDIRSRRRGYSIQWNFNVQRELPGNSLIEVAYLGNHGVSLPASRTFAYTTPEIRAMGAKSLELVPNPFVGLINVGILSQPQIQRQYLLRAFPQFTGVSGLDSWANSIYHGLTVRLEKRFSRGFSILTAYTFSKLIDDPTGLGVSEFNGGGANSVQDWANLRAERAISTSDLPQRLVLTGSWQPPVGRPGNPVVRKLATGWQLNSIVTLQSGNPIAVRAPAPAMGGSYPNVVGDPNDISKRTIDRWFNTAAFQTIAPYTMGNGPRNLPRTRTDGLFNWDFSALKSFPLREPMRLEFRAEFFSFTNTTTFGTPGTSVNSATYGVISSEASTPRQIQLGIKIYF